MHIVASGRRLTSAFLTIDGRRGSISRQARQRGVSRQRIYREAAWVQRQLLASDWQRERQALCRQMRELKEQLAVLQKQQPWHVLLVPDKQAEFVSVGQGSGVSLPQLRGLLEVLLGDETPSVATLGR